MLYDSLRGWKYSADCCVLLTSWCFLKFVLAPAFLMKGILNDKAYRDNAF